MTIPDGTQMDSNTAFTKIWRLRNEGAPWPENTTLIFVGGDQLSTMDTIPVASLTNGQEVDVAVDMIAPSKPGRYVGYWRLSLPDGSRFGQRVWVDICVVPHTTLSTEFPTPVDIPSTDSSVISEEMETTTVNDPMTEEFVLVNNPQEVPIVSPIQPEVVPSVEPVFVVEPKPMVPEPVQPSAPVVSMTPELAQLIEMGFTSDVEFLTALLNANGNDVLKTVQQLLQMK